MQASLLPNGHLVGTGEASRQSLSQSPELGRHDNKQMGAREMGERSQREAGRCTIISDLVTCSSHDTQTCGYPVCFTDQRTQYLLSTSIPLTQTGSTSPHTHTHTHTHTQVHTLPHTHILSHTHNLTQPHTLLTHSSHTLTHPHILLTHLHTSLAHSLHTPQTHTLFTPSHTQSLHTHTYPHINKHTLHTLTHTQPHTLLTCTHTHTQSQSLQEWRHRKHGDPGAGLTHQACAACGKGPESQLSSVTGVSTHWEPQGHLEAPWEQGRHGGDLGWPPRSRSNLTAL